MDLGIQSAAGTPITNPLPKSWLGRADVPPLPPAWANIGVLSTTQVRNLQAQIAYDVSGWNYNLIGSDNKLGRYQLSTAILEAYGLLAVGSNAQYSTDCVNYRHCWQPVAINNGINSYQNYFYNITGLNNFLSNAVAQEHLAYQRLVDIYLTSVDVGAITEADNAETVAGMIYVGWTLSVGTSPTIASPSGTGAWAWRYNNIGSGTNSYNSGRYSLVVLS
jgi:hypothetical protein